MTMSPGYTFRCLTFQIYLVPVGLYFHWVDSSGREGLEGGSCEMPALVTQPMDHAVAAGNLDRSDRCS